MAHHSRLAGFIIDCEGGSLSEAARFWSAALGLPVLDPDEGGEGRYARLDGSRHGLHIEVQRVEHPSRVHLDIESDDIEAEARRLAALGAKEIARPRNGRWIVLEAPTGHRFCVVRARERLHPDNANVHP
ncbi:VOC family protein [Arenimonas fontis]|uniref:VOC family protein n=1 Tax=Arenimonas fontis TaxID=2608255 RepID=A0A5B2Z9S2_9GAMM|nr:VOC family protein [Arenimonas fontis]KAA2285398.1 VOC family protein [Arenimonas fontis]